MASKGRIDMLVRFSCFLLFLMGNSYSQRDKLLQGEELKDGDELLSTFGNFKLGFFSTTSSSSKRYIVIKYSLLLKDGPQFSPIRTRTFYEKVVWFANRNTPIIGKSGSLSIDSTDGNLKIFHSGGSPIAITSFEGARNTSVTLEQSGNLVLHELHSNGSIKGMLWQSFDYPTDTLLPGMKLGINLTTGHRWLLRSWLTYGSPAEGSFTFGMDPNLTDRLIIKWPNGQVKWTSGLWPNGDFKSWVDRRYNFSYTSNEQEKYFSYSVKDDVTSFSSLQIDPDGSLKYYSGFSMACSEEGGDCGPYPNSSAIEPQETKQRAWWICLIIAIVGALVVILLCSLTYVARRKYKEKEEKWWLSLSIAAGVVLLLPLLCYLCYIAWRKLKAEVQRIMNRRKLLRELGDDVSSSTINNGEQTKEKHQGNNDELKIFNFETIAAATHNFSTANKLGEGGFGPVYKGKLLDDREIAIKRLSRRSGQGKIEFKNEAKLIAKLQHTNLVKLVGCSLQGEERILVYEYMHNKSLDFFIFDSDRKKLLDWKKRLNIIDGIAQGLIYLHKYSRLRVIHRDLKASNILLDDQMNPKISDFGMARIFGANESEVNTNRVVGTYGYMSPEYAMSGIVSTKTDVFSFGVLVLEIVSGKKNNSCYHTEYPLNLVGYAWQLWNEGKGLVLIDTALEESCSPNEVLRCVHVGLLCVQDQAADRPTMSDVVSMLTNETMLLPAPKQPAFFINVHSEKQEFSEIKIDNCSTNDVTISELEAR